MDKKRLSADKDFFEPVEPVKLVDQVIEQIEARIHDGSLSPGARLPSERELSSLFGIGRPSIREALQNLQARGLVEVRPGRGAYICDPTKRATEPFGDWEQVYRHSIDEVMEARLAIEPVASALAAESASAEDIEAMNSALDRLRDGINNHVLAERVLGDTDFHNAIMKASGNQIFATVMESINHLLIESRRETLNIPSRWPAVLAGHQSVLDRIVEHDPEGAARAMQSHLIQTVHHMPFTLSRVLKDLTYKNRQSVSGSEDGGSRRDIG